MSHLICPKCGTPSTFRRCPACRYDWQSEGAADYALSEQVGGDHYKNLAIQPVEFITKNGIPFLEGCVIKRVCRHTAKNGAEDIRKAIHELRLILKLQYDQDA